MTPESKITPPSRSRSIRENTTVRGYGRMHQRLRARIAPEVGRGLVNCTRCGERIEAGQSWDLGHSDVDRRYWTGPEHRRCNRRTATRKARKVTRQW